MNRFLWKRRGVGLDIGSAAIKALALERRGKRLLITGMGAAPVEAPPDPKQVGRAIQAALSQSRAYGEPVVASVGGPELVIRQVSLPPMPHSKIFPALKIQYQDYGLLPPDQAILDAQVLRHSSDGTSREILAVNAPKALVEERIRLLQQVAVRAKVLDAEPLAILNAVLHLARPNAGGLLVVLTIDLNRSVLCLFSERGPVVARYLEIGAWDFTEQLRLVFGVPTYSAEQFAGNLAVSELPWAEAEAACRSPVERMAGDIRISLAFYRSEYDRESAPHCVLAGWVGLPLGPWLSNRLGPDMSFEVMDPLQTVELKTPLSPGETRPAGPQFLHAFGLALRGL